MKRIDDLCALTSRPQSAGEELANTISHGIGLVAALISAPILLLAVSDRGSESHSTLSMSLYLGTGWLGLVVIRPLALAIPLSALLWLLAGGIAYTTGVLFFLNQRLRYSHFIWHLFVLGGTTCHFAAVISCMA